MILAETGGVLDELVPVSLLRCQETWARSLERGLLETLFRYRHVGDDWVVSGWIDVPWKVELGDYGVQIEIVRANNEGRLGSYHWTPPIQDLDRDFNLLKFRSCKVDREKTLAWKAFLEEHFGDILPIRIRGAYWWTTGLTWEAINLIGLEQLMLAMYDHPAGLHRLMAYLRDNFLHQMDWFEREGLLSLNNEYDYVGSGSMGFSSELPGPTYQGGKAVQISNLWGLSESQETVGVSPKLFEEFVFPYQLPLISRFGLSYYGCCEPVHKRIKIIKRIPNLRKVSVSPWADQRVMAEELGSDLIFCRKPNPTLISTDDFNEEAICQDVEETLDAADGVPLEFAMKDVHTLRDQPWRLGRWVELARQAIDRRMK